MTHRYNLRRAPVANPEDKYHDVLKFYKGDLRTIDLVQRKTDARRFMRKTYGIALHNDEKYKDTRIDKSEIEILRTLEHCNIITFADGYWNPGKRSRNGKPTGPRGALYTEVCALDSLRHLRSRFQDQNLGHAPEAFVWHVLRSLTDALLYLHNGYSSASEMLSIGDFVPSTGPMHTKNWQPISHGDISLFHILMDSPIHPEEYPREYRSFGKARKWPSFCAIERVAPNRSSGKRAKVRQEWVDAQHRDVDTMIREVILFCQGHSVELKDEKGEMLKPQLPKHYSRSLEEVLQRKIVPGQQGAMTSFKTAKDFAYALHTIFGGGALLRPGPLPEAVVVDLLELDNKIVPDKTSDWVYSTYRINDKSYGLGGLKFVPEVPCVHDLLELRRWDEKPALPKELRPLRVK